MQKIIPFLWYTKEAEEAARFYCSIFPDSRIVRVQSLPSESPSGPPGSVKIVEFLLFGQSFTAMSAGPFEAFNHAISSAATTRPRSTATGTGSSPAAAPSSAAG